jgi:hypothetical protein
MVIFAVGLSCLFVPLLPQPPERPAASLELTASQPDKVQLTVEITTASGAAYRLPIMIESNAPEGIRDHIFARMVHANWLADTSEDFGIKVYGVRAKHGGSDALRSMNVTWPKGQRGECVKLRRKGNVTVTCGVEEKEAGGKLPAFGPDLGPESYVEFDFSPVPVKRGPMEMARKVETTLKDFYATDDFGAPTGSTTDRMCRAFASNMESIGFKAEVVGGRKVRVYGGLFNGKFYPATRGTVTSQVLKAEELPIVKNPPQA